MVIGGVRKKRNVKFSSLTPSASSASAMSGIMFSARLNAAAPSAGNLFELDAIAASYIGGASSSGGIGSVVGAIIGVLIMASINNGISLLNMDISWQYMIKGMVLLCAVWFDVSSRSKSK